MDPSEIQDHDEIVIYSVASTYERVSLLTDCNHIVYKHIISKFSALILILSAARTCTQIDNFYYFTTRGHSSFYREFKNEGKVARAQIERVFSRNFLPRHTTIHAGLGSISAAYLRYLGKRALLQTLDRPSSFFSLTLLHEVF
jgi:hypothetical protein